MGFQIGSIGGAGSGSTERGEVTWTDSVQIAGAFQLAFRQDGGNVGTFSAGLWAEYDIDEALQRDKFYRFILQERLDSSTAPEPTQFSHSVIFRGEDVIDLPLADAFLGSLAEDDDGNFLALVVGRTRGAGAQTLRVSRPQNTMRLRLNCARMDILRFERLVLSAPIASAGSSGGSVEQRVLITDGPPSADTYQKLAVSPFDDSVRITERSFTKPTPAMATWNPYSVGDMIWNMQFRGIIGSGENPPTITADNNTYATIDGRWFTSMGGEWIPINAGVIDLDPQPYIGVFSTLAEATQSPIAESGAVAIITSTCSLERIINFTPGSGSDIKYSLQTLLDTSRIASTAEAQVAANGEPPGSAKFKIATLKGINTLVEAISGQTVAGKLNDQALLDLDALNPQLQNMIMGALQAHHFESTPIAGVNIQINPGDSVPIPLGSNDFEALVVSVEKTTENAGLLANQYDGDRFLRRNRTQGISPEFINASTGLVQTLEGSLFYDDANNRLVLSLPALSVMTQGAPPSFSVTMLTGLNDTPGTSTLTSGQILLAAPTQIVHTSPQTLTTEQQVQARQNINAAAPSTGQANVGGFPAYVNLWRRSATQPPFPSDGQYVGNGQWSPLPTQWFVNPGQAVGTDPLWRADGVQFVGQNMTGTVSAVDSFNSQFARDNAGTGAHAPPAVSGDTHFRFRMGEVNTFSPWISIAEPPPNEWRQICSRQLYQGHSPANEVFNIPLLFQVDFSQIQDILLYLDMRMSPGVSHGAVETRVTPFIAKVSNPIPQTGDWNDQTDFKMVMDRRFGAYVSVDFIGTSGNGNDLLNGNNISRLVARARFRGAAGVAPNGVAHTLSIWQIPTDIDAILNVYVK